jgi:hypothetical protein
VLCTADDIIRGKESDVASYMIHVILPTVIALLYKPWHCHAAADESKGRHYVGEVVRWVEYVLSHLIG